MRKALRLLRVRLAVLTMVLALPAAVEAQFDYTTNQGTATITKYTGPGGAVTIPSTIIGLPVITIGEGAFWSCTSLASVVISDGVADIASSAFDGCESLTSVTIPSSVTNIGDDAFSGCSSLTKVAIPASVTSIGSYVFSDCSSLAEITVDPVNPLYSSVNGVLFNKSQSTLIQYPPAEAGSYMIPGSVTTIENGAFISCMGLTSVTIPSSVTNMGGETFFGCPNLATITVDELNRFYSDVDGVLFDKSQSKLIEYPGGRVGSYTIPDNVITIGSDAFYFCEGLTNVTIANSVAVIGEGAFQRCNNLSTVMIGSSVTNIESNAFTSCVSLIGIYFVGNAPSLGTDPFFFSGPIIYYVAGTKGWGSTFGGVSTAVWNPELPFNYTINNGRIIITGYTGPGGVVTIPAVLSGLPVTTIASYAFFGCTNVTNVIIPKGVIDIGDSAFSLCINLAGVMIPNSVQQIGEYAFSGCTSLASVTIPDSVRGIGGSAFGSCAALTGAYFEGNAPTNGSHVFVNTSNVTVYYLPGTFGWGPLFVNRPAVMWNAQVQPGSFGLRSNQFGFSITGSSNLVVVIQATTSLANPTWSPLQTNTLNGSTLYFTDPYLTNYPSRFYRVTWP